MKVLFSTLFFNFFLKSFIYFFPFHESRDMFENPAGFNIPGLLRNCDCLRLNVLSAFSMGKCRGTD